MRSVAFAIGALALSALGVGCASRSGAVPHPFPMPGRTATRPPQPGPDSADAAPGLATAASPATVDTYALVGTALQFRGTPYRNGGGDPTGFDCSGFTQYVFAQYRIALPRAVRDQFLVGNAVDSDDLEAGDLIFFSTTDPGASHVGIAVGVDEFVHAPSSTGVVRVERISSSYWSARYLGARRVTPP